MKTIIWLILAGICLPAALQAQVIVNNQDINLKTEVEYIELIVDRRLFQRGEVFAVIDYGQVIRPAFFRQHRVQDKRGQDRLFGGEMDIFNFLYRNGWIHETTYSGGSDGCVYHIFRRKEFVTAGTD